MEAGSQSALQKLAAANEENVRSIQEQIGPENTRLTGDLAVARSHATEAAQAAKTREIAQQNLDRAAQLEGRSQTITAALKSLEQLRAELLETIPIPGFKLEAGVPYLNGIPLSEVNTQARAQFWLRVAAMRGGDLGVVCMDGAECFDDEHFQALVAAAKKTGLQWFFGRVDSKPFRVEQL